MKKEISVAFITLKLKNEFESLKKSKFEDKQLHKFIERAIEDLKQNQTGGTKIPKKLWPKSYIQKYQISNLWKYDLPNSWRLLYTVENDEIMILSVILEWFDHKTYERRFNY